MEKAPDPKGSSRVFLECRASLPTFGLHEDFKSVVAIMPIKLEPLSLHAISTTFKDP